MEQIVEQENISESLEFLHSREKTLPDVCRFPKERAKLFFAIGCGHLLKEEFPEASKAFRTAASWIRGPPDAYSAAVNAKLAETLLVEASREMMEKNDSLSSAAHVLLVIRNDDRRRTIAREWLKVLPDGNTTVPKNVSIPIEEVLQNMAAHSTVKDSKSPLLKEAETSLANAMAGLSSPEHPSVKTRTEKCFNAVALSRLHLLWAMGSGKAPLPRVSARDFFTNLSD